MQIDSYPRSVKWAHEHLAATRSRNSNIKSPDQADSRERAHKKRVSTKAMRLALARETAKRTDEAIFERQMRIETAKKPVAIAGRQPVFFSAIERLIVIPVFNRIGKRIATVFSKKGA